MNEEDILEQLGTEEKTSAKPKQTNKAPIDDEIIASMMANGDNTNGLFQPDEDEVVNKDKKEQLHKDQDDAVKLKTKGNAVPSEKYAEKFQHDMLQNPDKYFIETPKGRMSVKEAREKGYDPTTKRFNRNRNNAREQELLAQLNDQDRAAVEKLMDPAQVGLAPADAQAMGINPDSKMIRQDAPAQEPAAPTQPVPAAPQAQPDINSLLGGNA